MGQHGAGGPILNLGGPFEIVILWAHAMAAVAWVGGCLFYAAVLNPAMEEVGPTPERTALFVVATREFREVVKLAILVFVVTGAILAVDRLSVPHVTTAYAVVLAIKICLSIGMFWLAGRLGPKPGGTSSSKTRPWWLRPQYLILELGTIVYLLSEVLRLLYEQSLMVNL
jgi:putative copper export protein